LWLDALALTIAEKFTLSLVPITSRVATLQLAWEGWARSLARKKVHELDADPRELSRLTLQEVEDQCRLYSAYAWLSFRIPEYFPSVEAAQSLARAASDRVDALLQAQNAALRKRQGRRGR